VQATLLVGRARELAEVRAMLLRPETRLLTLVGPGGAGKTRLALQAAAEALDDFPDGVFAVALGAVTDPTLVLPSVAQALGVRESEGRAAREALVDHLRPRRLLLVLDNLEQLPDAAPAVADLLAACRELRVLATSRAALHLYGEKEYAVP